jgi:hypothetical protein
MRAHKTRGLNAVLKASKQGFANGILPQQSAQPRLPSERGYIVRGITGTSSYDLG